MVEYDGGEYGYREYDLHHLFCKEVPGDKYVG
jgi:hypothetical protein